MSSTVLFANMVIYIFVRSTDRQHHAVVFEIMAKYFMYNRIEKGHKIDTYGTIRNDFSFILNILKIIYNIIPN